VATYRFSGQAVVANDDILENATGGTFVDEAGATIPIYDLNDSPISTITSNAFGQSSSFKADVPMGYIKFGSVLNRVFADEIAQFAVNAQAAIATANDALTQANQALVLAQQALDGGGSGGGLPAGTTLEQIPNGTTRLAMTQPERDKIAATPTTFLQLGTTSTTAMAGNTTFSPAGIGAVQNVAGASRVWGRIKSLGQNQPTAAEGAAIGDWLLWDES
jgi:hypothetical protein